MKKPAVIGSLILIFLNLFANRAFAETVPASLTADEINYDYQLQQMEATGHVRLSYKDVVVESDQVIIDQEQDIVLALGNVSVTQKDSKFEGERFLYYLESDQGWVSPLKAEATDSQIKGPVQFTSEEAYIKGESIRTKKSTFTSCDLDQPHYHYTARAIEYYPGDRIVFHHVWYWEANIPLLYLPWLFISLKKENENLEWEVGRNATEGWWLRLGYNYYLNSASHGVLTTRVTEKGANEYGVKHYFDTSATSRWYGLFNLIDQSKLEHPRNDTMFGVGFEDWSNVPFRLERSEMKSWERYLADGDPYRQHNLDLKFTGQSPYPNLTLHYADDSSKVLNQYDISGNWAYNRSQTGLRMDMNGRWFYQTSAGTIPLNNLKYRMALNQDWGWSNANLVYDETKIYSGNMYSSNLKPDITYTIPKWKWPLLGEMRVSTEYINMEKFPGSSRGERWALDMQRSPIRLWQQGPFLLNWQSRLLYREFFIDGLDTEFAALSTGLEFTDQFTREFKTRFNLDYAEVDGVSNSYFNRDDNLLPGMTIGNGWYWDGATFHASLTDKYNVKTDYAYPAYLTARWIPSSKNELNFSTVYDWYQGPGLTRLVVDLRPKEDWVFFLSLGYDFSRTAYPWTDRQFGADIVQPITDKWKMELHSYYDFFQDAFTRATLGLDYDWHCRDLYIFYDYLKQEYWLQITFKALPDNHLKFSSNFEEFFDAINFD